MSKGRRRRTGLPLNEAVRALNPRPEEGAAMRGKRILRITVQDKDGFILDVRDVDFSDIPGEVPASAYPIGVMVEVIRQESQYDFIIPEAEDVPEAPPAGLGDIARSYLNSLPVDGANVIDPRVSVANVMSLSGDTRFAPPVTSGFWENTRFQTDPTSENPAGG